MIRIEFNDLVIEEVGEASGIFTGKNVQVGWRAVIKSNSGLGNLEGDYNRTSSTKSIVIEKAKSGKEK